MEKILIGTIVVLWGAIVTLVIYIKVLHQQTRNDNKEITQVIVDNTKANEKLANSIDNNTKSTDRLMMTMDKITK